jgi:hypothetical protein
MYRLILLLALLGCAACSPRKKSLSGEDVLTPADFVGSFPDIKLPFILTDTGMVRTSGDSMLIHEKLIRKFIPDTLFREFRGGRPRFHALGKAAENEGDQYVFIKASTAARQVGYLLVFDKENTFRAGMPVVSSPAERNTHTEVSLDRKFTLTRTRTRMGTDGQALYRKDVHIYNNVGTFMLILEESNEVLEPREVYNPIDSLPMTGKWSGNYVKDKKNFVAVRDATRANRIAFFIHFEANSGECVGQLKGEADIIRPGVAQYTAPGDPCVLELGFTSNAVTLSELKGCGNYRGVRCSFQGSYPRKASPKPRKK